MMIPRALAFLVLLASPALAEDRWTVGPLPPGDALNLRTGPAPGFESIGRLAPGADAFAREICVRLVTDPAETDAGRLPEWCRITRNGQPLGWVAARYLIAAEDALRPVRGWRGPEDECRLIGETALTVDFLDDSADLVGCPEGSADLAALWPDLWSKGGRELDRMLGYRLFSIPR